MRISDWSSDVCSSDLSGDVFSAAQGDRSRQAFQEDRDQLLQAIENTPALRDMPADEFRALTNQQIADMLFGGETLEQGARELGLGDRSDDDLAAEYATLADGKGETTTDGGHPNAKDEVRKPSPEYRANPRLAPPHHQTAAPPPK